MSLFDDVIVNAAAAVTAVGKMAEDVVDRSKLRVNSADLKRRISLKYETLGRYVFDTTTTGTMDNEVVLQYTREISELISELKTISDMLHTEEKQNTCPRCLCVNAYDSLYCKKCGASLDFTNSYTEKASEPAVKAEEIVVETSKANVNSTDTTEDEISD